MKRLVWIGLILLAHGLPVAGAQPSTRTSHALLIGISDYSYSERISSLRGPANDIALVQDVLKTRFGVLDNNITVLLDKQATHSSLRKAFANLADRVKEGDFVYIHYSGHGSTCEDPSQRRGQNQTWVSYGARGKNVRGANARDIVDKEINLWLQPLYEKARAANRTNKEPIDIIFVSDSCHSGTVARAIDEGGFTAVREVPPDPKACPVIAAAEDSSDLPGIRIGAARDAESAIELDPRNGGNCTDPNHCAGVFTWNWVKALHQAKPTERWEDVYKRTFTLTTADRFGAQRPQLEGQVQRPIFGGEFAEILPTVAVTRVDQEKGKAVLAAGAASNVTKGSVYRLYDAAGLERSDLPELVVTNVATAFTSEVSIRGGQVQVGDLVTEVGHAYPFQPMRVFISGDFAKDLDKPIITAVQQAFKGMNWQGFEFVEDRRQLGQDANLVIYVLRPQTLGAVDEYKRSGNQRLPKSFRDQPPELWVVSSQDELVHENMRIGLMDMRKGIEILQDNLRKFVWAQQVRQLSAGQGIPAVSVDVSVLQQSKACKQGCLYSPRDKEKKIPHTKLNVHALTRSVSRVKLNDSITFLLKNADERATWYAYMLDITPDGKIQRIFPTRTDNEDEARLQAKESLDLGDKVWLRLNEPGIETIKLIVSRNPIDVRLLENEQGYQKRNELNPLERLLRAAGQRRGDIETVPITEWGTVQGDYEVRRE